MSTKNSKAPATALTDMELMLYADGELEGEALAAAEAWLAEDRDARRKVLALGMTSSLVRDESLPAAAEADGIADFVMGAIAAEPSAAAKAEPKRDVAAKRDATASPIRRRPANDNARSFKVIAAVAVAAAAALLLWSRGSTHHPVTQPTAALTLPAPHDTVAAPEHEAVHGVEVSAVDFGGRTGAVFYVPTGGATSETTAVVWLSDGSSGGNE